MVRHSFDLRTSTAQKCAAIPRTARISGSHTFVSLNSRLESNAEEVEALRVEVRAVPRSLTAAQSPTCTFFGLFIVVCLGLGVGGCG